jgi:rRNA maturation endonuclease Nob1
MDANFMQQRMNEIQANSANDDAFQNALGKLFSGKSGYKPVIETKQIIIRCKSCSTVLDDCEKFCHECGTKVEKV